MMEINQENRAIWIRRYLEDALNAEEVSFFEDALEKDDSLIDELENSHNTQEVEDLIIQSIEGVVYKNKIKDLLDRERPLVESSSKNTEEVNGTDFFLNNFRKIAAMIAILIAVISVIYLLSRNNDEPKIGENKDTIIDQELPKQPNDENLVEENPDQELDRNEDEEPSVENEPGNEIVQTPEQKNPPVQVSDPLFTTIDEYRFKEKMGLAGVAPPKPVKRPVVIFSKKIPSKQIKDANKMHFLFKGSTDTIQFYGNVKAEELTLINEEVDKTTRYYLVQNKDTVKINKRGIWQRLVK